MEIEYDCTLHRKMRPHFGRGRCNILVCAGAVLLVGTLFVSYTIHTTESTWKARKLWGEMSGSSKALVAQRKEMVALEACENPNTLVVAHSPFAFVALLSDHFEEYAVGARKLAASLRMHNKGVDLILLELKTRPIPPPIIEAHLSLWKRCVVPPIDGPKINHKNRFFQAWTYSKLHAWRLTEYEAVVVLDLDMLALRDPSDLFDYSLKQMRAEGKQIGAVRDRPMIPCFPPVMAQTRSVFNAGMLLLIPNQTTFAHLVRSIATVRHDPVEAEQAFMNQVFKHQFYELSVIYNSFSIMPLCEPSTWNYHKNEMRLLHYTVGKPWTYSVRRYWHSPVDLLSCWFWGVAEYCALWHMM
jgi:glycogenin glucosyltransferase